MKNLFKHIKILGLFFKSSFMLLLSHRFNLLMSAVANIIWTIGQIIALRFLFTRIQTNIGWEFGDMVLLLAFGQLFFYSLTVFYYSNFEALGRRVLNGDLDRVLTRPINLKFALSFERISIAQIIPLVITVIPLIFYGISKVTYFEGVAVLEIFILSILAQILLYFMNLAIVSLAFYIDDGSKVWEMIISSSGEFNRVPLNVLPKVLGSVLTFVLPIALASYYPISVAKDQFSFESIFLLEIFLIILWIIIGKIMWSVGLKKYSSAS